MVGLRICVPVKKKAFIHLCAKYVERILAKHAMGLEKLLEIHLVSQIHCCQLPEVGVGPDAGWLVSCCNHQLPHAEYRLVCYYYSREQKNVDKSAVLYCCDVTSVMMQYGFGTDAGCGVSAGRLLTVR